MTCNNKQELRDKIKEKKESALNNLMRLAKEQKNTPSIEQAILKGNVEAYEDVMALIDSAKIIVLPEIVSQLDKPCEPAPEHIEEGKALLEPLCNKCGKTKEECPFHRMGSAYEDCSGFEEQKPHEIRNDRFREFETLSGNKVYIDAKEIKYIYCQECKDGELALAIDKERTFFTKKTVDYNDLIEWWKYWKQM